MIVLNESEEVVETEERVREGVCCCVELLLSCVSTLCEVLSVVSLPSLRLCGEAVGNWFHAVMQSFWSSELSNYPLRSGSDREL